MNPKRVPVFTTRKSLLASLIGLALTPNDGMALDFAQSPPGTLAPYVAPNVIISVDDSGSMGERLDQQRDLKPDNKTTPDANGNWPDSSKRMNVLKHALTEVFNNKDLLPDGKIRLAWQVMWNNGRAKGGGVGGGSRQPGASGFNHSVSSVNSMKVLDETHRQNFNTFIGTLTPSHITPSHRMFSQADAYMRAKKNINGPWAAVPGKTAEPYLGCRRNYHIMMTDGLWNLTPSGSSRDGKAQEFPDGTLYAQTNQTNVYWDSYTNSLADWAFYSWATNLQPSLYNKNDKTKQVPLTREYLKAAATENFGYDTSIPPKQAILQKYWNPRYDPATWPHMVTYTIGFSEDAYVWPENTQIEVASQMVPFGYDGSFPDLVTGKKAWPSTSLDTPNQALDLWHAAINGRGRFFAVRKGSDLEKAFRMIVQQINSEAEPANSSIAASGFNNSRADVNLYTSHYDPSNAWSGAVTALSYKSDGSTTALSSWNGKSTADRLDARIDTNQRVIATWSDAKGKGIPFNWESLTPQQQKWLNTTANGTIDTKGANRLKFLRGDHSMEGVQSKNSFTEAKPFRERKSRQGDIVNSSVWFVGSPASNYTYKGYPAFTRAKDKRQEMIYVGGNDGMLHGFSATNGEEQIAYVPRGIMPGIARLSDPDYDDNHRYFVDGSPMSGDVDIASASSPSRDWRTMLVGSLGAGGKGYFVLDVTEPASNFSINNVSQLVVLDKTLHASETLSVCAGLDTKASIAEKSMLNCANTDDRDMGHIFAQPVIDGNNPLRSTQVTKLNNGRWAVIMGNGYNSKNQRPVLLIQYLDGNKELLRLIATGSELPLKNENTTENGLSAPRLVDISDDGIPDVVYAGDLKGNLWKFIIASKDSSEWSVAFNHQPLFTAMGPKLGDTHRNLRQPITAPPIASSSTRTTGMMVAFGTGRNVTRSDPASTDVQSLYAVLDKTRYVLHNGYLKVCTTTACGDPPLAREQHEQTGAQRL